MPISHFVCFLLLSASSFFGAVRGGSGFLIVCDLVAPTHVSSYILSLLYTLSHASIISLHVGDHIRLLYHNVSLALFRASLITSLTIFGQDDSPVYFQLESKVVFHTLVLHTHIYISIPR